RRDPRPGPGRSARCPRSPARGDVHRGRRSCTAHSDGAEDPSLEKPTESSGDAQGVAPQSSRPGLETAAPRRIWATEARPAVARSGTVSRGRYGQPVTLQGQLSTWLVVARSDAKGEYFLLRILASNSSFGSAALVHVPMPDRVHESGKL